MTVGLDHQALVGAATDIAAHIVATAVWKDDRCNWVGAMPEDAGGRVTQTYRALGPDLYDGSAGVGLFLAELARATGDPDCHRTAVGALRHALSRAGDSVGGDGLYSGRTGIAFALVLAGDALEEPALEESALQLLTPLTHASGPELDLMSGSAGAAVGLLALNGLVGDARLLDYAVQHAEVLLQSVHSTGAGVCWVSPNLPDTPGLTGYSHGAAGVGVALLEVAAATGEPRFRAAADAGFAYERSLFDPVVKNWPDLRRPTGAATSNDPAFATFWCHGAPGGALARIRAMELGHDDRLEGEARVALHTTASWVRTAIASRANYSLCHGLAGNAEILLEGGSLEPEFASLGQEVAAIGIENYGHDPTSWPCGAHGGLTPGLFLGLAGIGRFYLRLAHPELPSLLLVRPDGAAV